MLRLRKYIKDNRGQSMVEFALMMPFLVLMMAGILDFSLILHQYMVVAQAAREGARTAAVGGDDGAVASTVKTAASNINEGRLEVLITPAARTRGNSVTVTVRNPVQTATQLIQPFFPSGFRVEGKAVMRVE